MRNFLFFVPCTLFAATIAVEPGAVLFENDSVKVVRAVEKPHVKGAFHEHTMNRVMVYLQPGKQRFEYQDGRKPAVFDYKAGQVLFSKPEGMHAPESLSDQPFNIIEVELKKPGTGKKIVSALDPPKIDPGHYKVEFENDQVRVLRAHMGPHEKTPMHAHTLGRVTVFLTDQNIRAIGEDGKESIGKHKAGDVMWADPLTHREENLNDGPFEVIAIEIKN